MREFQPVRRGHAAEEIFEELAASILRGELTPGDAMPPERVLGEQFGVSRMVLRQAMHRLAEVGLVRVRQGGATVVLDPAEVGDIRLIGLYYALDPGGEMAVAIRRDALEKQFMQGLSLIDVCARRGSDDEKASLLALATAFDGARGSEADFAKFEQTFWRAAARAGKNRIFEMEVVWWYDVLADARPVAESPGPIGPRIEFYRELGRRLVSGEGATQYYLAVTQPQLEAMFASARSTKSTADEPAPAARAKTKR